MHSVHVVRVFDIILDQVVNLQVVENLEVTDQFLTISYIYLLNINTYYTLYVIY